MKCRCISICIHIAAAIAIVLAGAGTAHAALKVGATAPDFTAPATVGGKPFTFTLSEALKQGPVVVYFYPAAFSPGCTVEAHEFAEAADKFKAMNASIIGVSADDMEKLHKFSVSECQSKFPVASDKDQKIMKAYDSVFFMDRSLANRTSYVITPDGKVSFVYSALNPSGHVDKSLAAVKQWYDKHKPTN